METIDHPKRAAVKNSAGIKFFKGNKKREYCYTNELGQEEKRHIVAEVKITNSPARLLCLKMNKKGNGPDILVPVVAVGKGLHTEQTKSKTQYQGPCFYKNVDLDNDNEKAHKKDQQFRN